MANKLELNWTGKHDGYALIRDEETGKPVQVPYDEVQPRLLVEAGRHGDEEADNILISGENLYALKTLAKSGYAGKIKCIYIDPPYNTGNAFAHYDDALEHSLWLTLMRDRLELLKDLLADDGSIWMNVDDAEGHHLKVLCDEIFGRNNFVGNVTWQKTTSIHNNATLFSSATDIILVYVRAIENFKMGRVARSERNLGDYSNPDNDSRGNWASSPLHVSLTSGQRGRQFATTGTSSGLFAIINPHGDEVLPPRGRAWGYSLESIKRFEEQNLIWWGASGRNQPRLKRFFRDNQNGVVPSTLWLSEEVGHNQEAKAEIAALFPKEDEQLFATPKPERLMHRIIQIATQPGDTVLDCFAGSGTTGAVALKMNRRFIMVEAGNHCETHIVPRLRKVIDGTDTGGISPIVPPHPSRATTDTNLIGESKPQRGWTGGGGFRSYTLGKSLIEKDAQTGVWRLNYTNGRLIEAVCLQEGFKLLGRGNYHGVRGRHYAHIADCIVTQEYVDALAAELAEDESLTLYCIKAKRKINVPDSVQLKRIPRDLLQPAKGKGAAQAEAATA